jgi:hypothetical protein
VIAARQIAAALADHHGKLTAVVVLRRQLLARKPNDLGLVFPSPRGEFLNDDNFPHRVFRPAVRRSKPMGCASTTSGTPTPP